MKIFRDGNIDVSAILRDTEDGIAAGRREPININYLLFQIRGRDYDTYVKHFNSVVSLAYNNEAIVGDRIGGIGLIYFMEFGERNNRCAELAEKIKAELSMTDMRILTGFAQAIIDNVGCDRCLLYGPYLFDFDRMFEEFCGVEYGAIKSVDAARE